MPAGFFVASRIGEPSCFGKASDWRVLDKTPQGEGMHRILRMALATAFLTTVGLSAEADRESLKAVHRMLLESVKDGNVQTVKRLVHPDAVGFFRESQFVSSIAGAGGMETIVPALSADLVQFSVATYDTTFEVIGSTGLVCAREQQLPQGFQAKKEGPRFLRSTLVYGWLGGRWQLISWHTSSIPLSTK